MNSARPAGSRRSRGTSPLLLFFVLLAVAWLTLPAEGSLPRAGLQDANPAVLAGAEAVDSGQLLDTGLETPFSLIMADGLEEALARNPAPEASGLNLVEGLLLEPPELTSRACEASFSLRLEPVDFGLNLQRGPPLEIPDMHQGWFVADPKTRIGGFRLELTRSECPLSLGLRRGYEVEGWGIAEEERPDPLGLQKGPADEVVQAAKNVREGANRTSKQMTLTTMADVLAPRLAVQRLHESLNAWACESNRRVREDWQKGGGTLTGLLKARWARHKAALSEAWDRFANLPEGEQQKVIGGLLPPVIVALAPGAKEPVPSFVEAGTATERGTILESTVGAAARSAETLRQDVLFATEQYVQSGAEFERLRAIDPSAQFGIRGSTARGTVGNPNKATFGQPWNPAKFDLDIFVKSDKLYSQLGGDVIGLPTARQALVEANPDAFAGLKPGGKGVSIKVFPSTFDPGAGAIIFPPPGAAQ